MRVLYENKRKLVAKKIYIVRAKCRCRMILNILIQAVVSTVFLLLTSFLMLDI